MSPLIKIPPDYSEEIKKKYFSHPFHENTFKLKRNLLIISFFSIILKSYDLKITTIPWLNIEVPHGVPNLLEGILALLLVYLMFVFIINFIYDYQIWNLKKEKDNYNWTVDKLKDISNKIDNISLIKDSQNNDEVINAINFFSSNVEHSRNRIGITKKWIIFTSLLLI